MSGITSTLRKTSPKTIVNHGSRSVDFMNNTIKNSTNTSTFKSFEIPEYETNDKSIETKFVQSSKVSVHPFLVPSNSDRFQAAFKKFGHSFGDINRINVVNSDTTTIKSNIPFVDTYPIKERIKWLADNFPVQELEQHENLPKYEINFEKYQLLGLNELPDLLEPLDVIAASEEVDRETKLDYFIYKFETDPKLALKFILETLQGNETLSASSFIKTINHITRVSDGARDVTKLKSYANEIAQLYEYLDTLNSEKFSSDLDVNYSLLTYFILTGYTKQAAMVLDTLFIQQGLTIQDDLFSNFLKQHLRERKVRNNMEKFAKLHNFRSAIFTSFNESIFKTLLVNSQNFSEIQSLIRIAQWKQLNLQEIFRTQECRIIDKIVSTASPKAYVSELAHVISQFQPEFSHLSPSSLKKILLKTLQVQGSYIYASRLINLLDTVDEQLLKEVYQVDNKRKVYADFGEPGYDKVSRAAFFQALNQRSVKK